MIFDPLQEEEQLDLESEEANSSIYIVPCFDKVIRMGKLRLMEDGLEGLTLNSVYMDWKSATTTVDVLSDIAGDVVSGLVGIRNPSRNVLLATNESNRNKVYLR